MKLSKKLIERVMQAFEKQDRVVTRKVVKTLLSNTGVRERVKKVMAHLESEESLVKAVRKKEASQELEEGIRVPYSKGGRSQYHKKVAGIPWNPRFDGPHLEAVEDAAQAVQPWDRYTEVKKDLRAVENDFQRAKGPSEHLSDKAHADARRSMEQLLDDAKKRGELRFGPDPEDIPSFTAENRRANIALTAYAKQREKEEQIERLLAGTPEEQKRGMMLSMQAKDTLGKGEWSASNRRIGERAQRVTRAASTPFKGDKIEHLLGRGEKKAKAYNIQEKLRGIRDERQKMNPDQYDWVKKDGTKLGEDVIKRISRESSDPQGDLEVFQKKMGPLLKLAENRAESQIPKQNIRKVLPREKGRFGRIAHLMRTGEGPELVRKVMGNKAMGALQPFNEQGDRLPPQIRRAMAQGLEKWEKDPSREGIRYRAVGPGMEKVMAQSGTEDVIPLETEQGRRYGSITTAQVPKVLDKDLRAQEELRKTARQEGPPKPPIHVLGDEGKRWEETGSSTGGVKEKREIAGKPVDTWIRMHLEGKRKVETQQQIQDLLTLRAVEKGEISLESVESPRLRMLIKTVLGSKKK